MCCRQVWLLETDNGLLASRHSGIPAALKAPNTFTE
jgi:hypothetical protein